MLATHLDSRIDDKVAFVDRHSHTTSGTSNLAARSAIHSSRAKLLALFKEDFRHVIVQTKFLYIAKLNSLKM